MRDTETGWSMIFSLPPKAMAAISKPSRAPCLETGDPMQGLSQRRKLESIISMWTVDGGMSEGSTIIHPFMSRYLEVWISLQKVS